VGFAARTSGQVADLTSVGAAPCILVGMTPEEVRGVRFRRAAIRGYRPSDVHSLLQRVAIQLEARQSPEILIRRTALATRSRGYRIVDVDQFLSLLDGRAPDFALEPRTWVNKRVRLQILALSIVATFAFISGFATRHWVQVAPFAVLWIWEAWLMTRFAIGADRAGVNLKLAYRTKRICWAEIRRFGVTERLVGLANRRIFAVELTDGRQTSFKHLYEPPGTWGWVDTAVHALNMGLDSMRMSGELQPPD
jgi:DivIVA domain-containing protein